MHWQTTRFLIDLTHPQIMGIVNVTPDSFSGGNDVTQALKHCDQLLAQGADLLDIGGESSRPGALAVSLEQEWARVAPVLRYVLTLGCPVSIDTTKPEIMAQALELGVDIVNDIQAFAQPEAQALVASHPACGLCLMHMQGQPRTMQQAPHYEDVVSEVGEFLARRAQALELLGVAPQRMVLDPGVGFGKTVEHNFELLARQEELLAWGWPLLVGWSRKSSLGAVTGRDISDRQFASVAAALVAVQKGAHVVRVHDVAATVDVLKVWDKVQQVAPRWRRHEIKAHK